MTEEKALTENLVKTSLGFLEDFIFFLCEKK